MKNDSDSDALKMSTPTILSLLGEAAASDAMEQCFASLNTLNRPSIELDSDEERGDARHYDWVLVRRMGVELGFVDKAYFDAEPEFRWGADSNLVLNQLTFFAAGSREGVQGWAAELLYGLECFDTRTSARAKLVEHESTRRSGTRDCWTIDDHHLVITYTSDDSAIENIHIKRLIKPWSETERLQLDLSVEQWLALFGESATSEIFKLRLDPLHVIERIHEGEDEREVDFTRECGIELYFENINRLKLDGRVGARATGLVFAAVKFYRARDREARQWAGELPLGVKFGDSIDAIIDAIKVQPIRREEGNLTGFALWHFPEFSLHILYSAIENNLLRITMMAPGYWDD